MKTTESHRKASQKWAKNNKDKTRVNLRNWRRKRMIWYQSLKKGKSCKYCGESNPVCLVFHHRDPFKKVSTIQRLAGSTANNEKVLEEIAKCALICSNCHKKIHSKI